MIIAIDGPSAAGKGTLARRLAETLDFAHLDTGLTYRAVAAKLLETGAEFGNAGAAEAAALAVTGEDLDAASLRGEAVSQGASIVAAMPAVRTALLGLQRGFAAHPPGGKAGAVLDGRDVGTVVCPDAEVKFFVTADPETRARRRHEELLARGETSIYARVLQDMRDRDARDSGRATAPLKPADDAIVIDTSGIDADAALDAALHVIEARRAAAMDEKEAESET